MQGRAFAVIPLLWLASSTIASADSFTDELERWLGFVNRDCGTAIRLEVNGAELKARGASTSNCTGAFDELRRYCQQDSGKPHPAGQEFVKQHVKAISCKVGPDGDKPVVKVSVRGGVLALQTTPGFGAQGIAEAMRSDPALSKIWVKRRVWDLENLDLPDASKRLKGACGDDVAMTIDVASWQARGKLLGYPDAAVADICSNFAGGLVKACQSDKAKTRARVTGIRCGLLPASKEDDPPQIRIVNKQVIVQLGTLGSNVVTSRDLVYEVVTGGK